MTKSRVRMMVVATACAAAFASTAAATIGGAVAGATGIAPTTTKLSATPSAPVAGQSVRMYAKVSTGTATAPTGTVTFSIDGVAQTPITVVASITTTGAAGATLSITWSSAGSHTIAAVYNGDTTYAASTATNLIVVASPEPSSAALSSSANPSVVGQPFKVYAKVTAKYAITVAGTVVFTVDGVAGSPVPVTSGKATLTQSFSTTGSHQISAAYSGDANHLASSTAIPLGQVVNKASTAPVVSSSANPSIAGQSINLTADVKVVSPGKGIPSGIVSFIINGVAQAPVAVTNGKAPLTTAPLVHGSYTIIAVYWGDANYLVGISPALIQTVN